MGVPGSATLPASLVAPEGGLPQDNTPGEVRGEANEKVLRRTFGERIGGPPRGNDSGRTARRVLGNGPPAEGERAPWTVAGGDFTTKTPSTARPFPLTMPAAAQRDAGLSRTCTSAVSTRPPAAEGTWGRSPAPAGAGNTPRATAPAGGRDPLTFSTGPSPQHKNLLPGPVRSSFPRKDPPPHRPAYLAWCWLPAPRSHEAGSPGTAPPKSRLSTRGGGSRRSSAPPGKPYLRGGSAGRGSAGCLSLGAPLPGGRSAPARPLRSPCGGRRVASSEAGEGKGKELR